MPGDKKPERGDLCPQREAQDESQIAEVFDVAQNQGQRALLLEDLADREDRAYKLAHLQEL